MSFNSAKMYGLTVLTGLSLTLGTPAFSSAKFQVKTDQMQNEGWKNLLDALGKIRDNVAKNNSSPKSVRWAMMELDNFRIGMGGADFPEMVKNGKATSEQIAQHDFVNGAIDRIIAIVEAGNYGTGLAELNKIMADAEMQSGLKTTQPVEDKAKQLDEQKKTDAEKKLNEEKELADKKKKDEENVKMKEHLKQTVQPKDEIRIEETKIDEKKEGQQDKKITPKKEETKKTLSSEQKVMQELAALDKEYTDKNGTFSSLDELKDFASRLKNAVDAADNLGADIDMDAVEEFVAKLEKEEKRLNQLETPKKDVEKKVEEKKEQPVEKKEEIKIEEKKETPKIEEKKEEPAPVEEEEEKLKTQPKKETVPEKKDEKEAPEEEQIKVEEKKEAPKEEELKTQPKKKDPPKIERKEAPVEKKEGQDGEELKVRKTKPVGKETAPQDNIEKVVPKEEKSAPEEESLKSKPPSESVRSFDEVYKEFYTVISGVDLTSGSTEQFIDQAKELIKAAESLIKKGEKKEDALKNLNETLNDLEKGRKQ